MTRVRRITTAAVVLGVLVLAVAGLLRAVDAGGPPSLQDRVDAVAATIRCPTCQGLSVADSSSVLAGGSREVIEEQLAQGRSPDEVRQWFVDRYGEYVLLSPDPAGPGLLVWLVPVLAVPLAGLLTWRRLRRSREAAAPVAESPAADPVADGTAGALAAYRDGSLAPDDSPAGDALHAALAARVLAEEDSDDEERLRRADARLAAAYRRYTARTLGPAALRDRGRHPGNATFPRRLVTVGSLVLLVGAAVVAVALDTRDGTGAAAAPQAEVETDGPGAGPAELVAATQEHPDDRAAWIALARANDHAGEYADALAAYDRAQALRPTDDVALLRAGLLVRAGSPTEALPVLTELSGRYPDNPDVLLLLGLAQDRVGDPQAVTTLQGFLELDPDSPAAPGVRRLVDGR